MRAILAVCVLSLVLPACVGSRELAHHKINAGETRTVAIGSDVAWAEARGANGRVYMNRLTYLGTNGATVKLRTSSALLGYVPQPGAITDMEVPAGAGRVVNGLVFDLEPQPDGQLRVTSHGAAGPR